MSLRISNLIHSGWLEREFIKIMSTCLLHVTHNFWMEKTNKYAKWRTCKVLWLHGGTLSDMKWLYSNLLAYSIFACSTLQVLLILYLQARVLAHSLCNFVCALLTISVFTLLMNFGFVLWTEMGRKEATDQLEITFTMEVVGWLRLL